MIATSKWMKKNKLILSVVLIAVIVFTGSAVAYFYHKKVSHVSYGATSQNLNLPAPDYAHGCGGGQCHAPSQQVDCHTYFCPPAPTYTSPYCILDHLPPSPSCPAPSITNTGSVPSSDDGYDAGYSYAEQYQICGPNYDNGNSQDFNDGVNAWTADNCTDGQPN